MIVEAIHALNEAPIAAAIRESQSAYPLLQVVHIVGFSLFIGAMTFANLRVAGAGSKVPLLDFVRYSTRIALFGLALVLLAGGAMFISFADIFFVSDVMRLKLIVLVVALGNLVILVRGSLGSSPRWFDQAPDPVRARKWVALSITACLLIITLGKLLAYIGGKD